MEWIQNYNPLGNMWLSALVAFLPIVLFFYVWWCLSSKAMQPGFLRYCLLLL
ncbi:hypothetical protein HFN_1094 [Helicobacter fennelliae MRY12-0050]|uniref:L-lactate permease n=1 Tax=Helicobacter fennelliae MRY12-0050 TaxID=1325130 RepID=T1CSQ2_9HELI|nr:hypothetical protein HFN_1094 [Helicobacter fennelliae MRY12-0050]